MVEVSGNRGEWLETRVSDQNKIFVNYVYAYRGWFLWNILLKYDRGRCFYCLAINLLFMKLTELEVITQREIPDYSNLIGVVKIVFN